MKQNWVRHSLADKQFSGLVNLLEAIERVWCWFWKGPKVWWNNFEERVKSGETRTEAGSWWCKRLWCKCLWCTSLRLLFRRWSRLASERGGMHFQRVMDGPGIRIQLFCCRIKHLSSRQGPRLTWKSKSKWVGEPEYFHPPSWIFPLEADTRHVSSRWGDLQCPLMMRWKLFEKMYHPFDSRLVTV